LSTTDRARTWLAERGYDKVMGARPLARVIRDEVKKPLTEEILFGALEKGGHAIIDLDPDGAPRVEAEGGEATKKGRLVFRFDADRAIDKALGGDEAAPVN
jgi:ATP-dependent Clp protease ATP-binding subunit ClpA